MSRKKLTYENSIQELENIINDLNENKISIDQLSDKVLRAKELLQWCSEKLRTTQEQIDKEE